LATAFTTFSPFSASLHELALMTDAPRDLASFYADALGYDLQDVGDAWLGRARGRRLRIMAGKPKSLAYAAYAVPRAKDLEALAERLDKAGVEHETVDVDGLQPAAIRFTDPDGNVFIMGVAAAAGAEVTGAVAERPARLQHVVFASTNVNRLVTFFIDIVGFALSDEVLDDAGGLRSAFLRCSDEHHSLAVFAAAENRLDHHCYEAEDWGLIRDWADHFADLRLPLKWGPGRHGPGNNLFLFVHDPDGNWLEVSAELERVAPDRPAGTWRHEERTLNSWGEGKLRS
jgi:catechol 2,3-dioxygenase